MSRRFDLEEARELRLQGLTHAEIARRLGSSKTRIATALPGRINFIERLGANVTFMPDGCWHWAGWTVNGYGLCKRNRKNVRAHRVIYELVAGPIPHGFDLDHLCRVRHCVNPTHLEPVTRSENILRGICARRETTTP